MHLIRDKRLLQITKQAYEQGQRNAWDVFCRLYGINRPSQGVILPGYNLDKELQEIMSRKACE